MRQTVLAMTALAAVAWGASAQAQNLLTNGTLDVTYQEVIVDNAPPGPGMEDFFLPKPASWINEGSRAITGPYEDEMSSEPWAGPAPTPVTNQGVDPDGPGGNPGDWAVFFKGFSGSVTNGAATGHLYQDNPATAGQRYILKGWAGSESNYLGGAEFALEFLDGAGGPIGGATIDLLAAGLLTPNGQPFNYKQYTVSAIAPAGTVSVRSRASMINGLPNPAGGGQALVMDDFVLMIPEPATGAMLMVGLGALATLRRRK
jgi:hypothetical protein